MNLDQKQKKYFDIVSEKQFYWLTENPYIAKMEREMISKLINSHPKKILEVGCGEGANIKNLRKLNFTGEITGIDYSPKKIAFAKKQVSDADYLVTDAYKLPFKNYHFDLVFCKNLLHHLEDKKKVIGEMSRVCKKGGYVVIIEANSSNYVVSLFARLIWAERGMFESTVKNLSRLAGKEKSLNIQKISMEEPIMFWRAMLHYQYGFPWLGILSKFFIFFNNNLMMFIPKERYGNLSIRLKKIK